MIIFDPTISGSLIVSGSAEFLGSLNVQGIIEGMVSGSSQISYNGITDIPSGIISGSAQLPNGIISSSIQLPGGIISGSSQLPAGLISGSTQLPQGIISGSEQLPSGLISSSTQLPSGTVSGSSQVLGGTTIHSGSFFNDISVVSGSSQISFFTISDKPTIVSGSSQISFTAISDKPTLISGSAQVDITSTTGYGTFSGSVSSDTIYRLYQPDKTKPFVYTDNGGNLHIDGNIIQSGSIYETHAEQVYSTKDYIILRSGSVAGLAAGQYTGIEALLYDGTNTGRLVFDNQGWARVGDSGSEQVIATRIAVPVDSQIAIWDAANYRLNFISQSVFASSSSLASHTALTTTAHGLGASAFHADNYFALLAGSASQAFSASTLTIHKTSGDTELVLEQDSATRLAITSFLPYGALSASNVKFYNGLQANINKYIIGSWNGTASAEYLTILNTGAATFSSTLQATTAILTSLTDGYIPYHISDTSGLINSPIWTEGTDVGIGTVIPMGKLHVYSQGSPAPSYYAGQLQVGGGFGVVSDISLSIGTDYTSAKVFLQGWNGGYGPVSMLLQPSGGNVGIGTATPGEKLQVAGAIKSTAPITIGLANSVSLSQEVGSSLLMAMGANGSTAGNLQFAIANSDLTGYVNVLRINNDGNVGIGTTTPVSRLTLSGANGLSPNTGAEVDYSGENLTFANESYTLGGIKMVKSTGYYVDAADMVFSTSEGSFSEKMRITSSGNVGIGTTANEILSATVPNGKLRVSNGNIMIYNTDATIGTTEYFYGVSTKQESGGAPGQVGFAGTSVKFGRIGAEDVSSELRFWTTSDNDRSQRMVIDRNGNVGIGTTGPLILLDITVPSSKTTVAASTAAFMRTNDADNPFALRFRIVGAAALANRYAELQTTDYASVDGGNLVLQPATGNVGIGKTDPNYLLELGSDSAGKPGAGGLWTVVSDSRIKTAIELADLDICYNTIKNIPLKRYAWAEGVYTAEQVSDRHNLGWIAQDVQKYFSKAVSIKPFKKANGETIADCLDLNSGQLYAAMYGAIQKLQEKVEILENK